MAARKSYNLLPGVFQTDTNKKFLSATIDQLISEPNLKTIHGYIGRDFAPTYKPADSYVIENTVDRQRYQLEPSIVVKDNQGEVTFFSTYTDLLDKIKYYGGLVQDHHRLFDQEYYSYDPHISFDKFVNFSQYYWLPNGPDPVAVGINGVGLTEEFEVIHGPTGYLFLGGGKTYTSLTLLRGGIYTFKIDQSGEKFWIQSEPGPDGLLNATPTISSRNVLGVENNGVDVGTITFRVPQFNAQERFTQMTVVYSVDYAAPFNILPYNRFHNQLLSTFLENYPEYRGITGQLDGKKLVFINVELADNAGDSAWTDGNVVYATPTATGNVGTNTIRVSSTEKLIANLAVAGTGIPSGTIIKSVDSANATVTLGSAANVSIGVNLTSNASGTYTFTSSTVSGGVLVPEAQRYGVWKVQFTNSGIADDPIIRFVWVQDVALDEKVYVKYGVANANKEYYKEYDGFFRQVPLITADKDVVYFQEEATNGLYGTIKIVEASGWKIDIEKDILGQKNYVSPNGITFTSGLKVSFDSDVIPEIYQNKEWYVENVGDSIRLVDIDKLVTPEIYNQELAVNYPLTRVILNINVPQLITGGTVLTIGGTSNVIVYSDVVEGSNYFTTLDPVAMTGIVGTTVTGNALPDGTYIKNVRPDTVFPEYITINRCSLDLNAWSRNNRWFHRAVLEDTATYNRVPLFFDQDLRAQRPIIQYQADLQLFNSGRIGKHFIDILDTTTLDAFTSLEGKVLTGAFGVTLFDGMRVLFAADQDPLVRDKVYVLSLVQYGGDAATGLPTGPFYIKLTIAEDGDGLNYDHVVVKSGQYAGSSWWYDGNQWYEAQQKTQLQQEPMFDVFDIDHGVSFSDPTYYPRSTFGGTKIFSYARGTGTNDRILGFPLKYRTFNTQGDIEFANNFNNDTFIWVNNQLNETKKISDGYLRKIVSRNEVTSQNTWKTVKEYSRQYQLISYIYDGTNSPFKIDIDVSLSSTITSNLPYIKVFKNNKYIQQRVIGLDGTIITQWTNGNSAITLASTPNVGEQVDILIFSDTQSKLGYYQVPLNLDLNAQNIDIDSLTLGQVRNHLVGLSQNSQELIGDVLGSSNLRDLELIAQGGTILQHSAPLPYASLFLIDDTANFINALHLAQKEYVRFKNKFLELSSSLVGVDPSDPVATLDLILTEINKIKNQTFPWYYSDMVPYGTLKDIVNDPGYIVYDPFVRSYEITNVFDTSTLSNQSVLVYLTPSSNRIDNTDGVWPAGEKRQLVIDYDYIFETDRPAVTILDTIVLEVDDLITIVEYLNTDGCYVPETPTKLGLYPRFIPEIFTDDTYRTSIEVIRGHDGSTTPAFGDYRDQLLLELEKRIYNNIKLADTGTYQNIFSVTPGKFRKTQYTLTEVTQLLGKSFMTWVGNNKLNFATNSVFDPNDAFTWNYSKFPDRLSGEYLPGSWRACFMYYYDTTRPHIEPWIMLGFSTEPSWWQSYYGPGPYTGGNKLLWDDLEAGLIRYGVRAGIDTNFARPGLSQCIPVDDNGFLKSPAEIMATGFSSSRANVSWAVGQQGPTEYAWRCSSEYPFAMQQALALAKPARYFGLLIDTYQLTKLNAVGQYLTIANNHHPQQNIFRFNGDTSTGDVYRGAGYLNWIADYLINQGINPATKITTMLNSFSVNLAYKMAGFSDQRYLKILAEQSSPSSTSDSILIPNENYSVHLNEKPVPVQKISYSAVIVEKTTTGFSVRGYDLTNSFFTIIPSVVNNNSYKIKVLNSEGVIFKDYQKVKLTVPYGFEFVSIQQVVDFIISYERALLGQGFTFNETDDLLNETRNWRLSVKEFLYWAQQGWSAGSIIVLSPVANQLSGITIGSIVQGIDDSQYGSRIIDQNFNLVKNNNYKVLRSPTDFKIALTTDASVFGYAELNLVQFEHALIFDNTTVFNDIIYKPELGNRQYRLKLIGQKTADWDGSLSASGFIYNSKKVQSWTQGKDYLKGDLVTYKNQYYVTLENITGTSEFNFNYWKQLDTGEIKTGLLPNFSSIAVKSQSAYDAYGYFEDIEQQKYSHGLIGFKPRQYLDELGLSQTTQIEFYKGYIRQKGTDNSVQALTKAQFNNLKSTINYYEEWAVRLGEYGAIASNPYLEVALDEKTYSVNPAIVELMSDDVINDGDGITKFNRTQLHKLSGAFNGNVALARDSHSNYDNDIPTAGYVNIDDVDATIFDLANYTELDANIDSIGSGYLIWCAKDFSQQWNVYRITETSNFVVSVANSLNGYITFTTELPHNLIPTELFLVKSFNPDFDGFYQVYKKITNNDIMVKYLKDPQVVKNLTTLTGKGTFFKLDSMRFRFMEDCRVYGGPPNQWKVGEKIWIDVDAETTEVQGQPFGTQPSGTWKVYEKTHPWTLKQQLERAGSQYGTSDSFGSDVKTTSDGYITVATSPFLGNGLVNTFLKDKDENFVESFQLVPDAIGVREFGAAIDLGVDAESNTTLAVASPGSNSNIGYVNVYYKSINSQSFARKQIITGNLAAGDRFGSSVAYNQDATWLYIGAPGNNRVYAYGLNRFVPIRESSIAVNNENNLFFSGNITCSTGDTILQPATGATARILETKANTANVKIDTLSNFVFSATITLSNAAVVSGNITINQIDQPVYPTSFTSVATKSSFNIALEGSSPFAPHVANDANSLLITSSSRTYIPGVDYSLSGNVVTFLTGNLVQADYTISQQPYYTRIATLSGNAGSQFGYALSSSFDGAQLAIGAPDDNVLGLIGAGTVWVYDRVIEAFKSTGSTLYTTVHSIKSVYRITIDGVEVNNYFQASSNTIRFTDPPAVGKVVFIETNEFILLEKLIGVNSLTGGTSEIQANAAFGTSLTICSNNCAIYIGAPYYDNGQNYNTGAVWKFHNRGRLYGTNNGYTVNPVFQPGDTFRLDNFEIGVTGRMMSTTINQLQGIGSANILALSGNISTNIGDIITQTISGASITVLANIINTQFVTVGNIDSSSGLYSAAYNNANVFTFGSGNITVTRPVWISNSSTWANIVTITSAYPMASLDSFIKDINDANVLGATATNENGQLRLNSDATVAKNLLRILAGTTTANSQGILATADMRIFAYMQIIINPFNAGGEYFGNKVKLASNAYMLVIGSGRGTTRGYGTFDTDTTYFDDRSTSMFDKISGSGSVYIYELYDDPRNDVEDPGRYAYAQQLDTGNLLAGDQFGASLDINGGYVTIGSPGREVTVGGVTYNNTGAVYIFENPLKTRGWNLIRYQQPTVDIETTTRMFLYDKTTNTIKTNLEFIDPAKGKILGQAEQELSYKTEYDPAYYNKGDANKINISPDLYWGATQVGQVWWNLSALRFIDYEQDTLIYRSINWGRLFPGSRVEIYEWVESSVLPSQYVLNGGDGVPKHPDNSAYVEIVYVDSITNIISSKYYYWVTDKTGVDRNNETRLLPTQTIADIIENPKNQGIAYAAIIDRHAIIVYNISSYLSAQDTILHVDYNLIKNTNLIHTEYELIQKNNAEYYIPEKISNKLIDSLAGINLFGDLVPDPKLSVADRYGIQVRPRQSMFVDRLSAVNEFVNYVNKILIVNPIVKEFDITLLNDQDPIPNVKFGDYHQSVGSRTELDYLDIITFPTGWKVLVESDITQDGLWVIYELQADRTWYILKVQSYKTNLYWTYEDWYATKSDGTLYSTADKITYKVNSLVDALKLSYAPGDIIRINNTGRGLWQQVLVNDRSEFETIGIQKGTVQINPTLGNFVENGLGFNNQGFDSRRFDQNPNNEIRAIVTALRDAIFTGRLQKEFNNMFFVMVNYLFEEQKYADWIFKTSFISATHQLRALDQYPNYVKDNQTYYQDYINEVKPYHTKIREYLVNYTGNDQFGGDITDFDLPSYYDTDSKIFRSPSGEMVEKDEARWQTGGYTQWYQNRNLTIQSILIENPGSGYTSEPEVTVLGGGSLTQPTARAYINYDTGLVTRIELTSTAGSYVTTPTVIINGTSTTPATAYAVLKNNKVRTFDTHMKFDRITYTSSVRDWTANTAYTVGDIVSYATPEGNSWIRKAYTVNSNLVSSGSTFNTGQYTVFAANAFTNANDRIIGYYQPMGGMPARDLKQLVYGVEYPGVQIQGVSFDATPLFSSGSAVLQLILDNPVTVVSGDVVAQSYIVNIGSTANVNNVTITPTITISNSAASSTVIYGRMDNTADFSLSANIKINGVTSAARPITANQYASKSGSPFDFGLFDNIEYNTDGTPLLSDDFVDTIIRSSYTDSTLGLSPSDIDVVGGSYVDRYSSHAPEELIPGIVFDTLDMRIYTNINSNTEVLGYRVFSNMLHNVSYLRIADAYTTELAKSLSVTDSEIYLVDASVLPEPGPNAAIPGVVFVNNERIVYWTIDYVNNKLGQLRRGTEGTGIPDKHPASSPVIDGSNQQIVPTATTLGNITLAANLVVTVHTANTANTYTRTITAGTTLVTGNVNIWYNDGDHVSTATNATGFEGSLKEAVLFLKAATANNTLKYTVSDELVTEDAINTLTTEDGNAIYEEDQ